VQKESGAWRWGATRFASFIKKIIFLDFLSKDKKQQLQHT
jgi:hypothetical protein